jgi:hypothetical protein
MCGFERKPHTSGLTILLGMFRVIMQWLMEFLLFCHIVLAVQYIEIVSIGVIEKSLHRFWVLVWAAPFVPAAIAVGRRNLSRR